MDYLQKIEELEREIKNNGFSDKKAHVHTLLMCGIFYEKIGKPEKQMEKVKQALAIMPHNPAAKGFLKRLEAGII